MHLQDGCLIAARLRERGRTAQHLRPVGGQPLDVVRMLVGMREGMVELGVLQAARVVRRGKGQKRGLAAGELKQRRAHGTRLAHGELEGQATDSRLAAREAFTRLVWSSATLRSRTTFGVTSMHSSSRRNSSA